MHSVLAAFSVGIALDVSLLTIAQAVQEAPPFEARLSPVELPNGIGIKLCNGHSETRAADTARKP